MKSQFISPESFKAPNYLAPSAWAEHIPFSFWLIENSKPKKIVELGTHYGVSYFAFCQAVRDNGLPSVCYAIDNWEGDEHAGFYDNSIFNQVENHNKENYSGFSYLLRTDFNQALSYFEDGTIDLLHIDGLHTYEAVKADFENWYPKLSQSGILLFHDISVREKDFGVYKLWSELTGKFPSFSFIHGFGLGVLATGAKIPNSISFLFDKGLPDHAINEIRNSYQRLGNSFSDKILLREREQLLNERNNEIALLKGQKEEMYKEIVGLGEWGRKLDKEIEEKNTYIINLRQDIENMLLLSSTTESAKKTLKEEKERLSGLLEAENKEKQILRQRLQETEENIHRLQKSYSSAETSLAEKDLVVANQSQTITFLKTKIEEYSQSIQTLEGKNSDKETIIQKQNEKEQSLYLQWDSLNKRLIEIYNSEGWKALNIYYKIKGKLIPENSKRYKYLKKTFNRLRGKNEESPVAITRSATSHSDQRQEVANQAMVYDVIEFKAFQVPVVSIIIPVFNGWAMTYKCLKSIYENTISTECEIIIADDGATDETRNIKDYIKNITVIRNKENLGFLNNCNNAAKSAKGKFILFLNNDTEVKPDWLSSLVELMEKDKSIGMTGSKFIYPDGRLQEAGGIIWKDASAWNFGHKQSPDLPEFNYVKEVDYISGAGIMIRTDLWKEIGGFDDRYTPAYCEDSDLAFEVRRRGFKVVYQPLSEIIHYEGYSHGTDEGSATTKSYQKVNNEKLYQKWREVLSKEHFENGENVFSARDRSRYKKTILVVDHYVPHFDKDAGSKTVFQYLKLFVSMGFNVKFLGDNFFRHEPYTTVLQQMGIEVLYGPWYANNWQAWIKSNHNKFDFVLLNRPHISVKYMDFIKNNTNAEIIYYGHDLHFMRMLKQYEVENKKEILEEAEKWKKIEISLFKKANLVLTPSEQEKKLIKELGVRTPVYAIKPYTFDFIPDPISDFSKRNDILFVGGFSHIPNVDAVTWFVREVWPQAKQKISGGTFIIVGSNVTPEIAALANDDIYIAGFVSEADLQKLYKKVKLVVVPLRYGAGVKGKTVEAMYNGIPLVTTAFGVEGLPGAPSFIVPKNNADEFAKEVIRLYNAPDEELAQLSKMETAYIHDHFHFEIVKDELQEILNKAAANADAI